MKEAEDMAEKVTRALTGAGLWGVEFFLSEVIVPVTGHGKENIVSIKVNIERVLMPFAKCPKQIAY